MRRNEMIKIKADIKEIENRKIKKIKVSSLRRSKKIENFWNRLTKKKGQESNY